MGYTTATLTLDATNTAPGMHALYAVISAGGRSRLLYAPELLQVVPARPVLDITRISAGAFQIGVNGVAGQTIILQSSTNLQNWLPVATNHLATSRWTWTNSPPAASRQYFQAVLGP